MALVDKEHILNQLPEKKLMILYNQLKSDYTEENVNNYIEYCKSLPLSTLMDNSRYVFGETSQGINLYEVLITDPKSCLFNRYYDECDKVESFIKENSNIPEKFMERYNRLLESMQQTTTMCKDIITVAGYAKETSEIDDIDIKLSDALCEYRKNGENIDEIHQIMESMDNTALFFTYAPFVEAVTTDSSITVNGIRKFSDNSETELEDYKEYAESVVLLSKLFGSKIYVEAVKNIKNHDTKSFFECVAKEDLRTFAKNITTQVVESVHIDYSTPETAVNDLFSDMFEGESIDKEDDRLFKENLRSLENAVYEPIFNLLVYEYSLSSDEDQLITGYNFFENTTTLVDGMNEISRLYVESIDDEAYITTEAAESNTEDESVQNNEKEEGTSSKK